MIKKLTKHRQMCRFFAALLALAAMLSMFLWLYSEFQKAMLQSMTQFNREFVEQVITISDALTNVIENSAMQMFYSSSIKNLRYKSKLTNAERILGVRNLGDFVSSSDFLDSAMVYNSTLGTIFTSHGGYPSMPIEEFYDKEAAELLTNANEQQYMIPHKRCYKGNWYYSFLFSEKTNSASGALLLNVRADWYESQLLGISSGANCIILDENGNVLVSGDSSLNQSAIEIWPTIKNNLTEHTGDGLIINKPYQNSLSWMYFRIDTTGWYYLKSFRLEQLSAGLIHVRNFVFSLLFILGCVLISSTAYVLIKIYTPLQEIRNKLQSIGQTGDDYSQQMTVLIENQKEQDSRYQFDMLLEGNSLPEFPVPVCLVLTSCENPNLVRDWISKTHLNTFCTKVDSGCILALSKVSDEEVRNLCNQIADSINSLCFIGSVRYELTDLEKCYENLLELQKMSFLYPGQQIFAESYLSNCKVTFNAKDALPLASALKSGQIDEAREEWRKIFTAIRYTRYSDFIFAVQYICRMMENLQHELQIELHIPEEGPLVAITDMEQLQSYMDSLFCYITSASKNIKDQRLQVLAQQIQKRIDAGFLDSELSVQRIADEMGMNAVYLGRLYRQSTGHSVNDALNTVRVEYAQKLLREKDDTVEQIAQQVGFSNIKYFYVIFKNITGMTPRQYRLKEKESASE